MLAWSSPLRAGYLWAFALLPLVFAAPAAAQVTPDNSLTLQAAMDRALTANPTIAAARLTSAINLAGRALAGERLNPEATVEFEKETPKQAYGFALPLELGGKRAKRIAVSEATIRAGEAELTATIAQVRNEVRRAYYEVLVADARLLVLREMRDLAQRVRDTAQARFDAGDAPRLEVLQASLVLAAAENETIAVQGTSVAARTRLNALIGQPLDTSQRLSTSLDAGGPVEVDAALNLARTGSAELALLDRQIEQQRARLALAHALRTPDLVPTATLTHDAEPEFTYGWRAGRRRDAPDLHDSLGGRRSRANHARPARWPSGRPRFSASTGEVTAAAAAAEAHRQTYIRYRDLILPQAQQVEQLAQDSYQLGQTGIASLLQSLQASRDLRLRSLDAVSRASCGDRGSRARHWSSPPMTLAKHHCRVIPLALCSSRSLGVPRADGGRS